jgi:hypothetical protein
MLYQTHNPAPVHQGDEGQRPFATLVAVMVRGEGGSTPPVTSDFPRNYIKTFISPPILGFHGF